MNNIEIIKDLCRKKGISIARLERELGLGNGTISKSSSNYMRSDRVKAIADYFHVSMEYLMTGSDAPEGDATPIEEDGYYLDPETKKIAQEIFDNPDLRILFDAARDVRPEDLKLASDMLKRMKGIEE